MQSHKSIQDSKTITSMLAIFYVGLKFINLEFKSRDAFQLKFQAWNRSEMYLSLILIKAAEALASQVTEENFADGLIYPPFTNIRKISANIAASVGAKTYELGLASNLPRPKDLVKMAEKGKLT
ncbi:hypothetical protein F2Q69_00024807 [Brassica cretica]|uniref:Malic enzyme NAD-binding domain-containing protein n=1 Tax=Brassica cretica TaxID=69181 RepID=A0A8S9QM23_BRACR|nr:hypothetical protein F2Q69_00024807 [Brassica cretica]